MPENTQDEAQPTISEVGDQTPVPPTEQTSAEEEARDSLVEPADQPREEEQAAPSEKLLPPEAQGETNGGPLGCCLGTMVGLLLSLSLAVLSRLYADPLSALFQGNAGLLGLLVRLLMGLLALGFAIFLGSVGWKLGKRFYREYEPPMVKQRTRRPAARRKPARSAR